MSRLTPFLPVLLCLGFFLNLALAPTPEAQAAADDHVRQITGQMMALAGGRDWEDHKGALQRMRADRAEAARLTQEVLAQAKLFNQALEHSRNLGYWAKQAEAKAALVRALYASAREQGRAACAAGEKAGVTAAQIKLQRALDEAAPLQQELNSATFRAKQAHNWLRGAWPQLKALGDKGQRAQELNQRATKIDNKYFGPHGSAYYYFEAQREKMKKLSDQLNQALMEAALEVVTAGRAPNRKDSETAAGAVSIIFEAAHAAQAPPATGRPDLDRFARQNTALLTPVVARLKTEPLFFVEDKQLQPPGVPGEHQRLMLLDERQNELLLVVHSWQQCRDAPQLYAQVDQAHGAARQARDAAQAAAQQAQACYARAEAKQKALLAQRCPEHAITQWDPAQGRATCACNAAKGWVWNSDHSDCVPLAVCRQLYEAHQRFQSEGNREQAASTLASLRRHKCPGQAQLAGGRTVPRVVGLSAQQAAQALGRAGLKYKISSAGPAPRPQQAGQVAGQDPAPGAAAQQGQTVRVSVYDQPRPSQAQAERCDRLGRIFNQAVKKHDLGTAGRVANEAQGCAWQAQAQTWVRCARLAEAYNRALETKDRRAAVQAVNQAQGCDWQAKAQGFLRCDDLAQDYDAAFAMAQQSKDLSGLKNILTQSKGCAWYDQGRSKALCLRAGLIFDRNIAARNTQEAGKALAYARQNNCYWRQAGERVYAQTVGQAQTQAARPAPAPRQQQTPPPQQAQRLTPQQECQRMNDIALNACRRSGATMDSLNAVFNPMAQRWKQLGCGMSPALDQCVDAVVERDINGIFRGWSLGR